MKKQVLLTILLLLPLVAMADDSGKCGENLTWTYKEATKTLTISGNGEMSYNKVPWNSYKSSIEKIIIDEGVTSIGDNAFQYCSGLTSVSIGNSVTSIGIGAFYGCSGLTSITIPDGVTSIDGYAFSDCSSLVSITIPDGVTSIEWLTFNNCSSLVSITIPDGVTSIGSQAFCGCSSLTSINIPDGVTSIGQEAFEFCSSLTSISIPDGVTSIGWGTFLGCSGLTSITIPDGVTSIDGYAFESCTGLTSVTIPNSVTNVGDLAFRYCSGLTSVELGMSNYGGSVFFGCSNLTKMILHGKSVSLSWLDQKPKYSEETSNIKEQIKEIVIGDDVNSINRVAFSGFTNLTSVDIPSSVTSIGNSAFSGCTNLATIKIPESVTSIGTGAFADCINLASIFFPENISIGSGAFDNTAWFNSFEDGLIYFGNTLYQYKGIMPENSTITIKEGTTLINTLAFNSCTGLCSITIPSSVTYIASRAFYGCSGLTSITIPDRVSIEYDTFSSCENIRNIHIDDLINWIANEDNSRCCIIGFNLLRNLKDCHLFLGDKEITNLRIPTDLESISGYAFYNCTGIVSVDIAESVTSIGQYAFFGCSQLKSMTIHCNRPPSANNYITSQEVFDDCVLYVPEGSENAYYVADGWKNFKKIETFKEEQPEKVPQDVNGDGIVDTQDVLEIYKYIQEH